MELGELELEILALIKKMRSATAAEVLGRLRARREMAYSTVITTLERLHRKGFLTRRREKWRGGGRHVFSISSNIDQQREVVDRAVDRFLEAFGPVAVSAIHERLESTSSERIEELKKGVGSRRKR